MQVCKTGSYYLHIQFYNLEDTSLNLCVSYRTVAIAKYRNLTAIFMLLYFHEFHEYFEFVNFIHELLLLQLVIPSGCC